MYKKIFLILWILTLCAGCANNYRLVRTTQMEAINQCAMASDHNHKVLLEQQQTLATGLDDLLIQLENSKRLSETLLASNCPQVQVAAPSSSPKTEVRATPAPLQTEGKQLVGAVEQVRFDSLQIELPARIDTGVMLSILDAREMVEFERNGENWVRFTLMDPASGLTKEIEQRMQRKQALPLRNGQQGMRRPIVVLPFTLGKISQHSEFMLTDRSGQEDPVVLGRQVLRDLMLVDVSRTNLAPLPPVATVKPVASAKPTAPVKKTTP